MENRYLEWLKQAEYDLETARDMFKAGRFFYSVFMCHLASEKALKGLYQKKLNTIPPKTHGLIYLLQKTGVEAPEEIGKFFIRLDNVSAPARYPEDLDKIQSTYNKQVSEKIIEQTEDALQWIKTFMQL